MDITNTMCRVSELSQWEIDSLRYAMPNDGFIGSECFMGVNVNGKWGNFAGSYSPKIISYDEMMQLLTGKSMDFTKQDLIKLAETEKVFVKYRTGDYRIYLYGVFNGEKWSPIDDFTDDLRCMNNNRIDVMSVYTSTPRLPLLGQLEGEGLNLIWERTELTPAQKEMAVLQAQMDEVYGEQGYQMEKLQTKMDELQAQMKVVQAKL